VFSPPALRTTIEQYIDACLSVARTRPPAHVFLPPTAENIAVVVDFTVTLMQDPQTGALQRIGIGMYSKETEIRCCEVALASRIG
jgi:hypothetical protein